METKSIFDGRPRLDVALRVVMTLAVVALLVASVATQDLRTGVIAVVLATFTLRETFVLPERAERASAVVFWVGLALWAFLAFG